MSPAEWVEIVKRMRGWWPQAALPDASLALWYDDLRDREAGEVLHAVAAVYRSGGEWPPNGAQILISLAQWRVGAPEFDKAWTLVMRALSRFGARRCDELLEHLQAEHPALAELAQRMGVRELALSTVGDRVLYAQARGVYEQIVGGRHQQITHRRLPGRAPQAISGAMKEITEGGMTP